MGLTCLAKILILQKSIIAHTQEAKSIAFESEMNIIPQESVGVCFDHTISFYLLRFIQFLLTAFSGVSMVHLPRIEPRA